MPILTIGYGGDRSAEEFFRLLIHYGVKYLVDVRTRPYSNFRPEFCREPLEEIARAGGLVYVFMGDALGGRPEDPTCYTDHAVDYAKMRERDWFIRGIDRLETGWRAGHRLAVMCAELDPERCHRSKLIGEALAARGVPVGHIDADGDVITHAAVVERITRGQNGLFDPRATDLAWEVSVERELGEEH